MSEIKVVIDMDSMSAIMKAALPYGAKPSYVQLENDNVVIYYESPDGTDDSSEVLVHLDFSEWATKTVRAQIAVSQKDVFANHSVFLEHVGDMDGKDVILGIDGASISPQAWAVMQEQLLAAFPYVRSLVVNAPGIGLAKLK